MVASVSAIPLSREESGTQTGMGVEIEGRGAGIGGMARDDEDDTRWWVNSNLKLIIRYIRPGKDI